MKKIRIFALLRQYTTNVHTIRNTMLTFYLIIVNWIALLLYGYDKYCARSRRWRVPEKTLIASAAIGGSLGAYVGMMLFRHKTQHRLFQISIPLLLIIQIIIFFMIY